MFFWPSLWSSACAAVHYTSKLAFNFLYFYDRQRSDTVFTVLIWHWVYLTYYFVGKKVAFWNNVFAHVFRFLDLSLHSHGSNRSSRTGVLGVSVQWITAMQCEKVLLLILLSVLNNNVHAEQLYLGCGFTPTLSVGRQANFEEACACFWTCVSYGRYVLFDLNQHCRVTNKSSRT